MPASYEREVPVQQAIDAIYAEFDQNDLDLRLERVGRGSVAVVRCVALDNNGTEASRSAGKGGDKQAYASALFEAWEHYWLPRGLNSLRHDRSYTRLLSPGEIISQPPLSGEAMLHRLAVDFPDCLVGCLRFDPIFGGDAPVWYPAFAKCPWYQQFPIQGDDRRYAPYLRYATSNGTAAGMSESEAILHALMEVIERDALSIALLDWYIDRREAPRIVDPEKLPSYLQHLCADVEQVINCPPLILDITTDLLFPAFCAIPSQPTYLGVMGSGASTAPSYALERTLSELVQLQINTRDLRIDEALNRRLANLKLPKLVQCVTLDAADLMARSVRVQKRPDSWWNPFTVDVTEQVVNVVKSLTDAGLRAYKLRWNPEESKVPVLSVLVPGMETFFLSQQAIPVLPTGRAAYRLPMPAPSEGI